MKKEKQVKSYQRRTKSGKVVTVKAHTAKYDAAEKAKEAAKKKGAGKELEDKFGKKKMPDPNLSMNEYLDELKKGKKSGSNEAANEDEKTQRSSLSSLEKKLTSKENRVTPKDKKPMVQTTKSSAKPTSSGPAFTASEFKEWYHGTGSAADKKVAKALRAQLGRSGYRKFEDEAINNYSSRGHLSMFKKLGSGGSSTPSKSSGGETSPKNKDAVVKVNAKNVPYNKARIGDFIKGGGELSTGKVLRSKSDVPAKFAKEYSKFEDIPLRQAYQELMVTSKGEYKRLSSFFGIKK